MYDDSYITAPTEKDAMVPPKPKKGEYIVCQFCRTIIHPTQLSSDPKKREKELKWHIHDRCRLSVLDNLDKQTPGLLRERRMLEKMNAPEKKVEVKRRKSLLEMSRSGTRR